MTTPSIVFIGDVSWDTTVVAPRIPDPDEKVLVEHCLDSVGGVAANSAIACSLAGANVRLLAPTGEDQLGTMIKSALESIGVASCLERGEGPTGRALIVLDESGEKRLLLYPGHRMYPSVTATAALDLEGAQWVHTVLYDLESAAQVIKACRASDIPWSIDLEPATIPNEVDALREHLEHCHTVFLNARAKHQLGPRAVHTLHSMGVTEVIETLGPQGARLHRLDAPTVEAPAPSLSDPVRDTTGAGDAFAGWYTSERVRGATAGAAVQMAVRAASLSVRQYGISISYPTRSTSGKVIPRTNPGKAHQ